MSFSTNPDDACLRETLPDGQYKCHLILSDEERAKGFVRPVRQSYIHETRGGLTRMPLPIAETYARNPAFYGRTFCCRCGTYYPVGASGQFVWADERGKSTAEKVGS